MAIDEDAFDEAIEQQLGAGGVVESQTGDERTRWAGPLELLRAREALRRQNAADSGGQFFTATPG